MKNYESASDRINVVAGGAVASGSIQLVGKIVGVAESAAAASGDTYVLLRHGRVRNVAAVAAQTPAQGAILYWDDTAKNMTTTSTNNTFAGWAAHAKAMNITVIDVLLAGGAPA